MIRVKMLQKGDALVGFTVSGHAGAGEHGNDIVCAAVSSAVYMTANTITEICGCPADIEERDGYLSCAVSEKDADRCQTIFRGFSLHMQQMHSQYSQYIELN